MATTIHFILSSSSRSMGGMLFVPACSHASICLTHCWCTKSSQATLHIHNILNLVYIYTKVYIDHSSGHVQFSNPKGKTLQMLNFTSGCLQLSYTLWCGSCLGWQVLNLEQQRRRLSWVVSGLSLLQLLSTMTDYKCLINNWLTCLKHVHKNCGIAMCDYAKVCKLTLTTVCCLSTVQLFTVKPL